MYIDQQLLLSGTQNADNTITAQEAKGTDTSVLSANVVDMRVKTNLGEGQELYAVVTVDTAASGGTSVECQAIVASSPTLDADVSVVGSSGALPVASITKGKSFAFRINPSIGGTGQRYLGLRFNTVGAVAAGKYVGFITTVLQDGQTFYPAGYAVI